MKIHHILPALAAAFVLTACNDKDGDWAPMKWQKNNYATTKVEGKKYIQVPKQGGTYTLSCKNYDNFWLGAVNIITSGYGFTMEKHITDGSLGNFWNPKHMSSDGITIDIDDNAMTVSFEYTDALRSYEVHITAGDIYDTIRFIQ